MDAVIATLLKGLPVFFAHLATTLLLFLASVWLYMLITPQNELKLVRNGNRAAAVSLAGAMLGLAIPLAACLAGSVSVLDLAIWGGVIVLLQVAAFKLADLVLRDLPRRIEQDELGPAIALSGAKLSLALLMAAAIAG
jgi:putative membrane protein